jgi:signal transduction histidine kinase/DNA-binding response OmpR family regulator
MNKQKILMVDDQEINLILVEKTLRDIPAQKIRASSGEEAIDILTRDADFDLIIMDVQMSGLNGFDTVKIIKESPQLAGIPVIFLTAYYNQSDYIEQGYKLGAFDYIIKPFDKHTLVGKVRLYLTLEFEKRINREKSLKLAKINRSLNILNEFNNALIYSETENELLNSFCSILVEIGKYPFVWINEQIYDNSDKGVQLILRAYYHNIEIESVKGKFERLQYINENCPILNNPFYTNDIEIECNEKKCAFCNQFNGFDNVKFYKSKFIIQDRLFYIIINANFPYEFDDEEKLLISSLRTNMKYGMTSLENKQKSIDFQIALNREKEELKKTLKGITDGVIFAELSGKILYCNQASCEILNLTEQEIKLRMIFDLFKVIDVSDITLFNPVDMIQNTKPEELQKFKLHIIAENTRRMILLCTLSPILSSDNTTFESFTFVFQDITEQIKLTTQLALSQKMESVGQLAAGIAHEINTPLQFIGDNNYFLKDAIESLTEYINLINSNIQKLENGLSCNDFTNYINGIKEELNIDFLLDETKQAIKSNVDGIQRVNRIVTAMKNFAHPSDKQKTMSNINNAIETTSVISKNEWKYSAELVLKLDNELKSVNCVLDEINQVLLNMIINAVHTIKDCIAKNKYEKGLISIETKQKNNHITIEISDNGAGIPESIIDRIYDPFFTTKPVGQGTGQGLLIAHDIIVNKHQGKIEVESKVGIGTKFIITLPVMGENNEN